jgi:hypothetical protein
MKYCTIKTPFFGNLTPVVLGALILIFTPVAISLSVSKVIDVLVAMFAWIIGTIQKIFRKRPEDQIMDIPVKASRFGDFNDQIAVKRSTSDKNERYSSSKAGGKDKSERY